MKTIFTLGLVLFVYASSFAMPTYVAAQTNWRWRNNDGGQKTATWKAAQNAAVTSYNGKKVIRLRIEIVNNSYIIQDGSSNPFQLMLYDSLQYTTTPTVADSWKTIGLDASKPFIISRDSV